MWPLVTLLTGLSFWVAGGQWGTGPWPGCGASPTDKRNVEIVLSILIAATIIVFAFACQQ